MESYNLHDICMAYLVHTVCLTTVPMQTASAKLEFAMITDPQSLGWAPAEVTNLLDVIKVDTIPMAPGTHAAQTQVHFSYRC